MYISLNKNGLNSKGIYMKVLVLDVKWDKFPKNENIEFFLFFIIIR